MSSGGRYRLVASASEGLDKLQILSVRASDAGLYHCHADFTGSPTLKTYSQLNVIGKFCSVTNVYLFVVNNIYILINHLCTETWIKEKQFLVRVVTMRVSHIMT